MRTTLDRLVAGLPERFEAVRGCGLPDTLVHGDFHPGNVRGTPFQLTLLDWGDTGVGQPLLRPARVPRGDRRRRGRAGARALAGGVASGGPGIGARGGRAAAGAGRGRAPGGVYQRFVDGIEPVERRHHDADAIEWLGRAAALAG